MNQKIKSTNLRIVLGQVIVPDAILQAAAGGTLRLGGENTEIKTGQRHPRQRTSPHLSKLPVYRCVVGLQLVQRGGPASDVGMSF